MAIFNDINPATTSGTALAGILNSFKDSVRSGFIGATRPTNLAAGGYWIDNSTEGSDDLVKYKYFDGTDDIIIWTVNTDTNVVTVAGVDLSAIEGDITTLQADVLAIQADITDLEDGYTQVSDDLDAHISDTTSVHGIADTADLLTTTNTKAVTNKDIDGGTASNTSRITVPKNTKANLDGLTRKVGTIVYATDEEKFYYDDGTELVEVGSGTGAGDGGKNYFVNRSFTEDLEGLKSYLEISAPAVGFFDGGGSGNIAAGAFTSLGIADGTPAIIYGDIAPPSSSSIVGKVVYVKNFSTFIGFSLTPGGATVAFTDTNDKGNYTVRFYYAGASATAHMVASINTSTGRLLNDGSLQIVFTDGGGVATNEGFEFETKVFDAEDYEKTKWIEVELDASSANYVAGNLVFKAIDLTNGLKISLADNWQIQKTKRGYLVPVYAPSSSAQVLVSVHMSTDTAVGNYTIQAGLWKFRVDTPNVNSYNGFELGTESWTDSQANATTSVEITRDGAWFVGKFTVTFTGAQSGGMDITIPTKYLPASGSYSFGGGRAYTVGSVKLVDSGTTYIEGAANLTSITNLAVTVVNTASTYATVSSTSATVPFTWASGDSIVFDAKWKVEGWSAGIAVGSNEFDVKGAQSNYTTVSGQTIPNSSTAILNFDSKIYDRLNNVTTGASWNFTSKVRDFYTVSAQVEWAVMASQAGSIWALLLYKNGVEVAVLDEKSPLNTTVSQRLTLHGSYDLELLPGDYVDVRVFQNDGGGRGISTGVGRNYISVKQNFDLRVFAQAGPVQTIQETFVSLIRPSANVGSVAGATKITGFTELRDDLAEWDSTNNLFRPLESGIYTFNIVGATMPANATGLRALYIYDVTANTWVTVDQVAGSSSVNYVASISPSFDLIGGRTYELHYYQNSGGNLTLAIPSVQISRRPTSRVKGLEATVLASYRYNTTGNANTSFANGGVEIADYNQKDVDSHNAVTIGASWRFTAPLPKTYSVKVMHSWTTNASLTSTEINLWKNGVKYKRMAFSGNLFAINGACNVTLAAGDYIDIRITPTGAAFTPQGPDETYIDIESL